MRLSVSVIGPPLAIWRLNSGITEPLLPSTFPKRVAEKEVGVPFLLSSAAVFVYILLAIVSTYAVPFVRDCLDTQDPAHLPEKLLFIGAALLFFTGATWLSERASGKRFAMVDLQL